MSEESVVGVMASKEQPTRLEETVGTADADPSMYYGTMRIDSQLDDWCTASWRRSSLGFSVLSVSRRCMRVDEA